MIHINQQSELKISPRRIKNLDFINHIKNKENSIVLDFESIKELKLFYLQNYQKLDHL